MAADDRSDDDRAGRRGFDDVAAARALRRIGRADAPPWLHTEIARRLGERLTPMRVRPRRIVDWWASIGAGAAVLRSAYPNAERIVVEPWAAGRGEPSPSRPWWSLLRTGSARALTDADSDAAIGQAQLLWANMA
ncbi:MAG: hypothetical protein ABIO71_02705, partial [Caldimonas sp.]